VHGPRDRMTGCCGRPGGLSGRAGTAAGGYGVRMVGGPGSSRSTRPEQGGYRRTCTGRDAFLVAATARSGCWFEPGSSVKDSTVASC